MKKPLTDDERVFVETTEGIMKIGEVMAMLPEIDYGQYKQLQQNPLMLQVCSSMTDIETLTRLVNENSGKGFTDLVWTPMEGKIPSGDDAIVKCNEAEAKYHRMFKNQLFDLYEPLLKINKKGKASIMDKVKDLF